MPAIIRTSPNPPIPPCLRGVPFWWKPPINLDQSISSTNDWSRNEHGDEILAKAPWNNICWGFWKRFPRSYKEAIGRNMHFSSLSASHTGAVEPSATTRVKTWEPSQRGKEHSRMCPGGPWAGQTQSCLDSLVCEVMALLYYLATCFGVFYILKPKISHPW